MTDRTRVAGVSKDMLKAAREARVHRLFISEEPDPGETEHVNAAVSLTRSNGGSVTVVPGQALPEVLAAILRY
jgi:stalled ribosome rescue protein Dom34